MARSRGAVVSRVMHVQFWRRSSASAWASNFAATPVPWQVGRTAMPRMWPPFWLLAWQAMEPTRCPSKLGDKAAALETLRRPELTDDGGGVLVLSVDGEVEAADVGGGEFAGKI